MKGEIAFLLPCEGNHDIGVEKLLVGLDELAARLVRLIGLVRVVGHHAHCSPRVAGWWFFTVSNERSFGYSDNVALL